MSAYTPSLQDAINALEHHGCQPKRTGDQWQAYCPVHEADAQGHNPSLSLKTGDTQPVVFNCHAGCGFQDIAKALGLERTASPSKIVAEYDYHDAAGVTLFQKVRMDPKDFRVRHQTDPGAKWDWHKPKLNAYPLYPKCSLTAGTLDFRAWRAGESTLQGMGSGSGQPPDL